ncbi:zinc ribbon domain-containing protein [Lacrimispora sp. BS-2]|uniref:Zinc ribbon domain-containing protein n=1 Tax=Lacrimispora sp. BS-2 TaxID=3151850 RepID=A0AAU7PJ87_9FIRM
MADLKSTFSKGLTVLNVKTSNFLELNKIKTYIATLKSEIATLMSEIGEIVYQDWTQGEVAIERIQDKLMEIAEKEVIIKQQQAELDELELKEKQILGGQNSGQNAGAVSPAGGRLMSGDEDAVICPNCGQRYELAVNFCRKCGTKLK